MTWQLLFLIVSLILAILATLGVSGGPRFSLFPASFAAFVAACLVGGGFSVD